MSRMNDLAVLITELHNTAHALNAIAEGLQELFSSHDDEAPIPEVVTEPTEGKAAEPIKHLTLEDIRPILARKSAEGHGMKIQELIRSYGVDKLSKIPEEHYPELLKAAEVL